MGFMAVVADGGISWMDCTGAQCNIFHLPDGKCAKKLLAEGLGTSALITGKIWKRTPR